MPRIRHRKLTPLSLSVREAEEVSGVSRSILYIAFDVHDHPEKYGLDNPPPVPPLPSSKVVTRRITMYDDLRDWLIRQRIAPTSESSC
jgi:hypothetical protein